MPNLPTPSSSRHRHSIGSSFSFGPQSLVNSLTEGNSSIISSGPISFALDPNRSILPASPFRSSPAIPRRTKASANRHPLANDTTDVFQDSELEDDDEPEGYEWGMVDRMRLWRHDALMQHLYETAAFWGDKVVSWTNDPNDAFWLAQTYFQTHQYSRAERLLTRPFPTNPPPPPRAAGLPDGRFGAFRNAKGKEKETEASFFSSNPLQEPRLPVGGAGELFNIANEQADSVSRLVDMSVACRYLAAQCQVRQGKWTEATEMLGEANPFRGSGRSGPAIPNMDGGIKIEASMCHLRGLLMLKLNRGDQAKHCFMEALALDVKCYESFDQLISGEMMTLDEEWEFVQSLAFKEQTPADAEFIRMIYTSRLRKYKHAEEHATARHKLVEDYGLGDNPDVLYGFADALFSQFRWADCFVITSRILGLVSVHAPTMPLHIACLYQLSHLHSKLFILAHELVEREPESPISWYAVGVWYLTTKKWSEARAYFSKTSLMDPRFAPAWIAFAHTFALEGEHDHAVTAYSTCARMFTGSHLPLLFIGMEHIVLSNLPLADEALFAAQSMCDSDPLLINEQAVMAYNHGQYEKAAELFDHAISLARATQSSIAVWVAIFINLGTCFRKMKRYPEAKKAYGYVLEFEPQNAIALGFLGMVHHLMNELDDAIVRYHETLSINPINGHIIELLNLALENNASAGIMGQKGLPGGDEEWSKKMREHRNKGKDVTRLPKRGDDTIIH
ncbi:TPR-like protein [Irpex rosettiformis]|uniref:TPR-like protein n=1 Tax=Irpex rosettiformis TaxID=378272 RepID=A0ACB8TZ27_9APHY|nr:TPR-like protein [Irpex rosettiformis]